MTSAGLRRAGDEINAMSARNHAVHSVISSKEVLNFLNSTLAQGHQAIPASASNVSTDAALLVMTVRGVLYPPWRPAHGGHRSAVYHHGHSRVRPSPVRTSHRRSLHWPSDARGSGNRFQPVCWIDWCYRALLRRQAASSSSSISVIVI
jgi:hypothetical protein